MAYRKRILLIFMIALLAMSAAVVSAIGEDDTDTPPGDDNVAPDATVEIANDEGGPVVLTGEVTYTNPFFTTGVSQPLIILEDQAGFVDRNEYFLFPQESQVLGQITSNFYESPFTYSVALPIEPQGSLRDVDHDGEEDTGVMYFINAEHPWTVLYRDKNAIFLEEELTTRKLGVPMEYTLVVRVFRFQKNDVIIIGSDGRDDIHINESEEIKIMNEDERQILYRIEDGRGILRGIVDSLLKKGRLTDDLSLLRIEFLNKDIEEKKNLPPILHDIIKTLMDFKKYKQMKEETLNFLKKLCNVYPLSESINKLIIYHFLKSRKYKECLEYLERFLYFVPDNNDFLYLAFILNKHLKKTKFAFEIIERLLLREPQNTRYQRSFLRIKKTTEVKMENSEKFKVQRAA